MATLTDSYFNSRGGA